MRFTGAASRSGMMHDSICCRVHLQREQTEQWTVFLSLLDRGLQMLPDGRARRPHREHSGGTRGEVELINEGDDGHQCDAVRHHIPFRQRGKDD